ncbi:MAG TPA: Rrf2 family transcriptional regulator [Thermoanaerobaculia bacterium]|nr:Rrf2 family transcriptional regulator [Thermoanaerobaculia bacterium]
MKLTRRSEYALLALIHLARAKGEGYVSVAAMAEAQGLPAKFLEQLLMALKRARLVKSQKGPHGGYRLARPAEKISLAEVIRLLDGALAPTESVSTYFYEPTPVEREKRLLRVFKEIRDLISARLEKTTLADVR